MAAGCGARCPGERDPSRAESLDVVVGMVGQRVWWRPQSRTPSATSVRPPPAPGPSRWWASAQAVGRSQRSTPQVNPCCTAIATRWGFVPSRARRPRSTAGRATRGRRCEPRAQAIRRASPARCGRRSRASRRPAPDQRLQAHRDHDRGIQPAARWQSLGSSVRAGGRACPMTCGWVRFCAGWRRRAEGSRSRAAPCITPWLVGSFAQTFVVPSPSSHTPGTSGRRHRRTRPAGGGTPRPRLPRGRRPPGAGGRPLAAARRRGRLVEHVRARPGRGPQLHPLGQPVHRR